MGKLRHGLMILLLATALVAGACGTKTSSTSGGASGTAPTFPAATTMAALQQKGKIIVGTKFDQPLFGLKNPMTGAIEGFDVEVAKIMAQGIFGGTLADAAKHVEFVETVSKVREPSIQEGKVDIVVATYTINNTRK